MNSCEIRRRGEAFPVATTHRKGGPVEMRTLLDENEWKSRFYKSKWTVTDEALRLWIRWPLQKAKKYQNADVIYSRKKMRPNFMKNNLTLEGRFELLCHWLNTVHYFINLLCKSYGINIVTMRFGGGRCGQGRNGSPVSLCSWRSVIP